MSVGDTVIPVEATDMFEVAADVTVKASRQGASGGSQLLTFTGISDPNAGSLVGAAVKPTTGLGAALRPGAGIEAGVHQYAFTWVTASGETTPSPVASVTHGVMVPPTTAPTLRNDREQSAGDPVTTGFGTAMMS